MLDKITTLAHTMFNNKGVYALLLGSGVSRGAGIPTGWEITIDLIRQIAAASGEDAGSEPEKWLLENRALSADYSDLLDQLAKTPAERRAVLARYIEPSDSDNAEGLKKPTPAHRAIATLVLKGYVRVIITTNFDRLLETALKDVGIEPSVIASDDAAKGAVPIAHAQCTVIKVHGDYLDTRIKNTDAELATYSDELNDLLDRVFDEFGTIVCGWSATWDPALNGVIQRCKSRRYSTYWSYRGAASDEAVRLIQQRGAEKIEIDNADAFFAELESKILALEEFSKPHPLSSEMAVAMTKRYILDDGAKIKLNDLVEDCVEDAISRVPADMLDGRKWDADEFARRRSGYEAALASLLPVSAIGARWCKREDEELWVNLIPRLLDLDTSASGATDALDFRRYPALLTYYAMGVGAVSGQKYGFLFKLLATPVRLERKSGYVSELLSPYDVVSGGAQNLLPGQSGKKTPLSNYIATNFTQILPRDITSMRFDTSFDIFEILTALVDIDRSYPEELPDGKSIYGFPVGRYVWRRDAIDNMLEDLKRDGTNGWLQAGFFEQSAARAVALLELLKVFSLKNG